ncbi:MAG: hypothetical protein MUC88_11965 [Planctomycetes bacterium]|nr:hypothetical protein [Planctomycetota bacterium]
MERDDLRDGGDQYSGFEPTALLAGKPNQTLTVRMKLEGSGETEIGEVYVYFYVSADTAITASDYYLGRLGVYLSASGEASLTWRGTLPTAIPTGSYYVGWIIDPDNRFVEADETNNTAYKTTAKLNVLDQLQSTVYVDVGAKGANNGSSWPSAFTSLRDALAAALPGREIRVARGIYTPDRGVGVTRGNREASFVLSGGITILGGYAGAGAPDPGARDVNKYATILSGDLSANDLPVTDPCNLWKEATRTDNSRHILTALNLERETILDGFQITGGCAYGSSPTPFTDDLQGAGVTMSGGSLQLRHCTFTGNWSSGDGGAIYADGGSLALLDCTFRSNGAGARALPATSSSASNPAHGTGGAVRTDRRAQITLSGCQFTGNFAGAQGGALDTDKSEATLTRCLFIRNSAGSTGGGAIWNSESQLRAVNCIFNGNRSDYSGGAIANGWSSALYAANCCLHANYAKVQAGALDNFFGATATLWNCTLVSNRQDGTLSAIVCGPALGQTNSELTIANSILWNGGHEISSLGKSLVTVGRTDIRGGWTGTGNLNADPGFFLPAGLDGIAGTEDDNLRLGTESPCREKGDNALLPQDFADLDGDGNLKEILPFDLDGRERITGITVDMGAYEVNTTPVAGAPCK